MPDLPARRLVVAESTASAVEGVAVVRRSHGRRGWARLDPEAVLDVLDEAGPEAIVLAPDPVEDPGAASLMALGRQRDHETVLLPGDRSRAAWVVAVAGRWAASDEPALLRRVQSVSALASACADPAHPITRLGWRTLGRLAGALWRPCEWCRRGGGLPGARCSRCGARWSRS